MPYAIRKKGATWEIVRRDTGEVVGHSDSKAKAQASVRARYANEAIDIAQDLEDELLARIAIASLVEHRLIGKGGRFVKHGPHGQQGQTIIPPGAHKTGQGRIRGGGGKFVKKEKGAGKPASGGQPEPTPSKKSDQGVESTYDDAQRQLARCQIMPETIKNLGGGISDTKQAWARDPETGEKIGVVIKYEKGPATPEVSAHEVAAYYINTQLGNMAPRMPAVVRHESVPHPDGNHYAAAVMKHNGPDYKNNGQMDIDSWKDMNVFDHAIANTDRHGGNWMHKGAEISSIDHGYSFRGAGHKATRGYGPPNAASGGYDHDGKPMYNYKAKLEPRHTQALANMRKNKDKVSIDLQKHDISSGQINALWTRIDGMINSGTTAGAYGPGTSTQ